VATAPRHGASPGSGGIQATPKLACAPLRHGICGIKQSHQNQFHNQSTAANAIAQLHVSSAGRGKRVRKGHHTDRQQLLGELHRSAERLYLPSTAWLQDMMSMPCELTPIQLSIHAASAMARSSLRR